MVNSIQQNQPELASSVANSGAAMIHNAEYLRRLATVVIDSNDAIILHDFDGKILAWNRGAIEIYGYGETEALGMNVRELIASADREAALNLIQRIRQGDDVKSVELRRVTKDGRILDIWLTATLLTDAQGKPASIATTERDFTERKQAMDELIKLKAEVEASNRELEAFSYSVSHDLRAPLRHIAGFVELLKKHSSASVDEKGRHYLEVISTSTVQMGQLIDDILTFSRIGRIEMMMTKVPLDELVQEALATLQPEMVGRDIVWKISPLPEVHGERAMLKLVLINLVGNALKFSRPRAVAEIEVGSRTEGNETICYVRDNGAGFDMRYVDKLFGLFQRLHRPEDFEGTGVGLANVRRMIQRHGGRVWAEGEVDEGATFYFSIPKPIGV